MGHSRERHIARHTMRRPYYGDYRFYHPNGELMFITSKRRVKWYLERDMVVRDPHDPKKFTFKEEPRAWGFWDTSLHEYHLRPKKNQCVVCGTHRELTKHHVLPVIFQRHYPNDPRDAGVRGHDMLLLCLDCHETYEQEYADPVRNRWAKQYGANQNHQYAIDSNLTYAIKAARTLSRYGGDMPSEAKKELRHTIAKWTQSPPTEKDIQHLNSLSWSNARRLLKKSDLGKKVTDDWDLGELRKFWRRHFVESMNPQYLPEGWSINAPVEKEFMKES